MALTSSLPLPRVTEILQAAGLVDGSWFTDYSAQRGQALHKATEYLDRGGLLWESVDPVIEKRLYQYLRFLDEVNPAIISIEEEVTHATLGYVGHLDRRAEINGREGVYDIKSGGPLPWHGVQLAMYAACLRRPLARWNLYLTDDNYKLVERTDRRDWEVAKAAMTIAAWRRDA